MWVLAAYTIFLVATLVGFRLVVGARWRRRSIQDLLGQTSLTCRQLRDLEKAMKQAFEEAGIPKLLIVAADLLTVLCLLGVGLVWIYLPAWYLALGATAALVLLSTILFYLILEFTGPWWGFPAHYIRSRLEDEACHDWDGGRCRACRVTRPAGRRCEPSLSPNDHDRLPDRLPRSGLADLCCRPPFFESRE